MSVLFSARQVAEEALRLIGAYSPNDSAADGVELDIALTWMDLNLSQLAGTRQLWFLVSSSSTVPMVADQASYDLSDILTDDLQFPQYAHLDTGNGTRHAIRIVSRREFENLSVPAASGEPYYVHIDRLNIPTMRVYPVPTVVGASVILTHQGFLPDIADKVGGNAAHGLSVAWQRWLALATAIDIGSGPVRRMQVNDIASFERRAQDALAVLMGFNSGSEHTNAAPISASSDAIYSDGSGYSSDYGNQFHRNG